MSNRLAALCVLAGCGAPAAPPAAPAPPPPPFFTIRDRGIGPIGATTPANLTAIRELLGPKGFTVRPVNDGGVELHVYDGDEHLFYVIPNDDGSLFNVHVVSSHVPITQHPEWVVGEPFVHSDLLTYCEPWGEHPVCWRDGDHVAVGFRIATDGLDTQQGRRSLEGVRVQRAIWSPQPFQRGGGNEHVPSLPEWVPREDP